MAFLEGIGEALETGDGIPTRGAIGDQNTIGLEDEICIERGTVSGQSKQQLPKGYRRPIIQKEWDEVIQEWADTRKNADTQNSNKTSENILAQRCVRCKMRLRENNSWQLTMATLTRASPYEINKISSEDKNFETRDGRVIILANTQGDGQANRWQKLTGRYRNASEAMHSQPDTIIVDGRGWNYQIVSQEDGSQHIHCSDKIHKRGIRAVLTAGFVVMIDTGIKDGMLWISTETKSELKSGKRDRERQGFKFDFYTWIQVWEGFNSNTRPNEFEEKERNENGGSSSGKKRNRFHPNVYWRPEAEPFPERRQKQEDWCRPREKSRLTSRFIGKEERREATRGTKRKKTGTPPKGTKRKEADESHTEGPGPPEERRRWTVAAPLEAGTEIDEWGSEEWGALAELLETKTWDRGPTETIRDALKEVAENDENKEQKSPTERNTQATRKGPRSLRGERDDRREDEELRSRVTSQKGERRRARAANAAAAKEIGGWVKRFRKGIKRGERGETMKHRTEKALRLLTRAGLLPTFSLQEDKERPPGRNEREQNKNKRTPTIYNEARNESGSKKLLSTLAQIVADTQESHQREKVGGQRSNDKEDFRDNRKRFYKKRRVGNEAKQAPTLEEVADSFTELYTKRVQTKEEGLQLTRRSFGGEVGLHPGLPAETWSDTNLLAAPGPWPRVPGNRTTFWRSATALQDIASRKGLTAVGVGSERDAIDAGETEEETTQEIGEKDLMDMIAEEPESGENRGQQSAKKRGRSK
jgi:hypothetical protein